MLIHFIILGAFFYIVLAAFTLNFLPDEVPDFWVRVFAALWPIILPVFIGLYLGALAREVLCKKINL